MEAITALVAMGSQLHARLGGSMGATEVPLPELSIQTTSKYGYMPIAVCGAHMEGLPLNYQLTERSGRIIKRATTAPSYRFYRLPGGPPFRPGLVYDESGGAIEVEVWELPIINVGGFQKQIPSPLGLGQVKLAEGESVVGFLYEAYATEGAEDITAKKKGTDLFINPDGLSS